MTKNNLKGRIEIEYDDDCFWRIVSQSLTNKGIEIRQQNPQIDFIKCRTKCPLYFEEISCDNYCPLSKKLNLVPELE